VTAGRAGMVDFARLDLQRLIRIYCENEKDRRRKNWIRSKVFDCGRSERSHIVIGEELKTESDRSDRDARQLFRVVVFLALWVWRGMGEDCDWRILFRFIRLGVVLRLWLNASEQLPS